MPVDLRYHITSLIAVFSALLIGVLIGIALVGDPELERRVQFADNALRERQDQIEQLDATRKTYENFSKEAGWLLTANVLAGKRVAVIYAYPRRGEAFAAQLPRVLEHAGATVTSTTTVLPAFRKLERSNAVKVFQLFQWPVPIEGDLRGVLAAKLAVNVAEGKQELPAALKDAPFKLIAVDGDYTQPADCVILVAGLNEGADPASVAEVEARMIHGLQEAGHRVVACEGGPTPISTIEQCQTQLIPTVRAADTPYGQLALVLAIDRANGSFGPEESALWPRLEDYLVASPRPAPAPAPAH